MRVPWVSVALATACLIGSFSQPVYMTEYNYMGLFFVFFMAPIEALIRNRQ